jgi:MFS family permease
VPPEPRAARPWPTLFVTSVALFMVMLDMTIVNVALPSIQRELGAAISDLEWVVNGFTLALASLILVGAKLGDRFGRADSAGGRNDLCELL